MQSVFAAGAPRFVGLRAPGAFAFPAVLFLLRFHFGFVGYAVTQRAERKASSIDHTVTVSPRWAR
jgi:hypothetical protein